MKVKECVAVPKSKKLLQFTLDDGTGSDRVILSGIHAYYEPEELVGRTLIAITNLPPRKMMGVESCGMLLSAIHEEEGEERLNLLMVDDRIPAGASCTKAPPHNRFRKAACAYAAQAGLSAVRRPALRRTSSRLHASPSFQSLAHVSGLCQKRARLEA